MMTSLSSGTNGSPGLKKKIPIRMLTLALFGIGGIIAAVATYQQLTIEPKPYSISHEEAIRIALVQAENEPDRDATLFPNEDTGAKLIHVNNTGMGFITDENSLVDMLLYTDDRFPEAFENAYLWHVNVYTSNSYGEERGYWYLIDASSGKVLEISLTTRLSM